MVTDDEIDARGCRGTDPAMWISPNANGKFSRTQLADLRNICAACPVRDACRAAVMADDIDRFPYAFVGGLTWGERQRIRRGLAPVQANGSARRIVAACGTYSGFVRHVKRHEEPCAACREARKAYKRAWRQSRKANGPTPIDHGTHAGYAAHRRRREEPCTACREARNAYQAELRDRRNARLRTRRRDDAA